jgi:hypothetical protein
VVCKIPLILRTVSHQSVVLLFSSTLDNRSAR